MAFARGENEAVGFELTEDSSRCVVTGETGLTHTRTISQFISFKFLMVFGALSGRCGWWLGAIGMESNCRRGRLGEGGNDRDRGQIDVPAQPHAQKLQENSISHTHCQ